MFREIPPTAGAPLKIKDLYLAAVSLSNGKAISSLFEDDLKAFFKVDSAFITYSGTAAFYLILESLKEISKRDTVIIPGYICPLVGLAVARAGLKIKVCDINKDNYSLNLVRLSALCDEHTLAVVPAHLGGFVCDMEKINSIAKGKGAFVIEDCAQAMGAEYKGKKAGVLGDFGFFSLCRGKGLTIYEGGIIISREDKYKGLLKSQIEKHSRKNIAGELLKIFELIGLKFFYNPILFWFVFRLPKVYWRMLGKPLKAEAEDFTLDFGLDAVGDFRKLVGHFAYQRLTDEIKLRKFRASRFREKLKGISGLRFISEYDTASDAPLYLPVIFDDKKRGDKIFGILEPRGLGVSKPYLAPITGYDYLKDIVSSADCPNAEYLSAHSFAISTTNYMKDKDFDKILDVIRRN